MRWEHLSGDTGFIVTDMAIIPTYRLSKEEIILIDSGAEPDSGLAEAFAEKKLRVSAVLSTHLHTDHIANNRSLIKKFGTKIYASRAEISNLNLRFSRYSTQNPIEKKYLAVKPNYPIISFEEMDDAVFEEAGFSFLPTEGHSVGHIAIITPDHVCCLGDALLSDDVLKKAKMPYMEDVERALQSMVRLRDTDYPCYVAAHKGIIPGGVFRDLADANIQKELELYERLRHLIHGPIPVEDMITIFMRACGIHRDSTLRLGSMRRSAKARVDALVRAGEFRLAGDVLTPSQF